MGTVSVPNLGPDPFTVNASVLNGKVDPLVTEFNGNIDNSNIAAGAAIAATKLNLATIAQVVAMSSKEFLTAKGADVASGTSIALGTDGNTFDITGTTTIQTITIKQAGSIVVLQFDGALTLTDDTGNLELQGSDLVVAAEDHVILKSDGTNWHLVSWSKRGIPTTAGKLEFVANTATTAVATIAFTSIASGYDYLFVLQNVQPAGDGVALQIRTSTDNGTGYDSGASDYTDETDVAETEIALTQTMGNATGEGVSADVTIFNPGDTTHTHIVCTGARYTATGTTSGITLSGKRNAAEDVDAVQFQWSDAGNFTTTGNITVLRRKRS